MPCNDSREAQRSDLQDARGAEGEEAAEQEIRGRKRLARGKASPILSTYPTHGAHSVSVELRARGEVRLARFHAGPARNGAAAPFPFASKSHHCYRSESK
jgi:hypothetical protein